MRNIISKPKFITMRNIISKPKFGFINKVQNLFKKEKSELETVILNFLTGDGYKEFAKIQVEKQQQEYFRLQEIQRLDRLKERFEYLQYKLNRGMKLSELDVEDLNYCTFLREYNENKTQCT